jgi:two-component system nitrate/nitrite response regulator NarL
LARLLEGEPDLEVVARCGAVHEALKILPFVPIDVVLLDYVLSGEERGLDFLLKAKQSGFQGKILVVTAGLSDQEALHLLRQGVVGIFLKEGSPELLAKAIRKVMVGEIWLGQREMKVLLEAEAALKRQEARSGLTAREMEVLQGIFQGLANKEISARLKISEGAVKAVVQQLFRKNRVSTRGQLVRVAMEKYREQLTPGTTPRTDTA